MPIVLFTAALPRKVVEQHSGKTGGVEHLRFLAFFAADWRILRAVSPCIGATHRREFPQSGYKAVDIIKVVENVNGDAQAFPSG
jgi:hypothetical protein